MLRTGGRFCLQCLGQDRGNEFADVVTQAVAALFPQDPPRFLARTPHGYHDVETISHQLGAQGLPTISTETLDETSRAASPRDPAIAYCQGTPLRNEIEARDPSRLEEATRRAAEALAQRFGSGAIEGRIRAHVVTAVR